MPAKAPFLLPNAPTLICACSATLARCWLSTTRHGEWTLEQEIHDDEGTLREQEMVTDRPGRTFDRAGQGRHAMEPGTRARDHEKRLFARRVAAHLNKAIADGEVRHLVLLSGPKFLGLLRSALADDARQAVVFEASKNLSALDVEGIRRYFS